MHFSVIRELRVSGFSQGEDHQHRQLPDHQSNHDPEEVQRRPPHSNALVHHGAQNAAQPSGREAHRCARRPARRWVDLDGVEVDDQKSETHRELVAEHADVQEELHVEGFLLGLRLASVGGVCCLADLGTDLDDVGGFRCCGCCAVSLSVRSRLRGSLSVSRRKRSRRAVQRVKSLFSTCSSFFYVSVDYSMGVLVVCVQLEDVSENGVAVRVVKLDLVHLSSTSNADDVRLL